MTCLFEIACRHPPAKSPVETGQARVPPIGWSPSGQGGGGSPEGSWVLNRTRAIFRWLPAEVTGTHIDHHFLPESCKRLMDMLGEEAWGGGPHIGVSRALALGNARFRQGPHGGCCEH